MALEIGTNPIPAEAIASRLAVMFEGEIEQVRVDEPDTVIGCCAPERLKGLAVRLKAHAELGYQTLNWIAGVDLGDRLETVYHLYSWKTNTYLQLHVELGQDAEVETVCDLWPSAEWLEREAYDMFGIRFTGHPDLRRILLKDDFIGHPLRKDYIDLPLNHPHV